MTSETGEAFNLDAYLLRVGLPARVTVDPQGLSRLQRAHRQSIPFENLDVMLGRGVAIDSASVFAKLVERRRGGYCFEHGRLFGDALAALGFRARPLLARVWLGVEGGDAPPLTHTLSLVTFDDGSEWIADAGFGGSYTPPMTLVEADVAEAPDGARFRLSKDGGSGEGGVWTLWRDGHAGGTDGRDGEAGWRRQYSFALTPVEPADLMLSNHWVSTAPASRFTRQRIVSMVLPTGFAALTDRAYRRRAGNEENAAEITDPRVYRMRLSLMFGIDLSADEAALLFPEG